MNEIQISINHQDLQQLLQLLELARSNSNQKHVQVFQTLKLIEENPVSYLYLAYLFNHQQYDLQIRRMAGLTMSSALKRNLQILHFSPIQLAHIKFLLLQPKPITLNNIKSMIISNLINKQNFDFQLLNYLISRLPQQQGTVNMLIIILQDLKYKSQNYNIFQTIQFKQSISNIYANIFEVFKKFDNFNYTKSFIQYMKCLNLLTFHCPSQHYHYLKQYIDHIIHPLMILSQDKEIQHNIIQLCHEGLNQIIATKPALIQEHMVQLIVNYKGLTQNIQIRKSWINILIQLIENDQNNTFSMYLGDILPKVIDGLIFTAFDQRNIRQEMEIQYNPYGEDSPNQIQHEADVQAETFQSSYGGSSYTLRKLSFQLIEKISIHYTQNLWSNWSQFIINRMQQPQSEISQTAISFIGIIAQTCMYDMTDHLENIINFLLKISGKQNLSLIRATSLWCLQKLFQTYKQNNAIVVNCLKLIFQSILEESLAVQTTTLMLKQASISFLDQIISKQQNNQLINSQIFQHIVLSLNYGLNIFTGRALFNVFKTYSTIFENHCFDNFFTKPRTLVIVTQLCKKWNRHQKSDSVMCPLIQCLITAFEGKYIYFQDFSIQFMQQIMPLLKHVNRKQLILRCIDFLSSILSKKNIKMGYLLDNIFLDNICFLIQIKQKQINHFAYGLISDIGKNYNIQFYVEKFMILIGQTMDQKSLTSLNNALMCLTDLLTSYSTTLMPYYQDVLTKVYQIIINQKLQSVYAFNFARIFGRLSLLNSQSAKQYLIISNDFIKFIFLSLRTREVTALTSDAFRGLINTFYIFTRQQLLAIVDALSAVIETLICYPIRRQQNAQNQSLLSMFIAYTKHVKDNIGQQNWRNILEEPIFLSGALKTIQQWTRS